MKVQHFRRFTSLAIANLFVTSVQTKDRLLGLTGSLGFMLHLCSSVEDSMSGSGNSTSRVQAVSQDSQGPHLRLDSFA